MVQIGIGLSTGETSVGFYSGQPTTTASRNYNWVRTIVGGNRKS